MENEFEQEKENFENDLLYLKCNKHDLSFFNLQHHHLQGVGCPECMKEETKVLKLTELTEFKNKIENIVKECTEKELTIKQLFDDVLNGVSNKLDTIKAVYVILNNLIEINDGVLCYKPQNNTRSSESLENIFKTLIAKKKEHQTIIEKNFKDMEDIKDRLDDWFWDF